MDENLQRILEELNRLLGEWRQELSASDRARMEWLRNTIQEATKIVNNPAQTLESQEASAADISRDQAELDDLAQEALRGKPDYTFHDVEKVVAELAAEMVPLFTSGIAEDNTVMATNFVLTYLFGDPIPIGGPSDWADMAGVLANAADRLTLFPTHLTREDHLRAIISGLRSDNKITANQFDALMLNRSSHRYANIPEADRLWAQWYLPQLVESLPRFMTEAVDQASTPQIAAGANVNVPSDFRPVNFGRLVISMVDEISAKDFAAGNSVVPPTQPPEPENVDLRDAFGRGPTGGEAKLEDAVKDVLRVQGHLVEEAQIDDSDTAKGTTEAIKQFVAELKSKRARWRSEGFDEDQIADALFRTAEQFAKRGVVAEGQRIVDGAVPEEEPLPTLSPFEESVRNEAAKVTAEAIKDPGQIKNAVSDWLFSVGVSDKDITPARLSELEQAVSRAGSLDALEQFRDLIDQFRQEKANVDFAGSPDQIRARVESSGIRPEKIDSVIRQIQIGIASDPLFNVNAFLNRLLGSAEYSIEPIFPDDPGRPLRTRRETGTRGLLAPPEPEEIPIRHPVWIDGILREQQQPFAGLPAALAEDRSGETALTPLQAVEFGLSASAGFDPGGRPRPPTIGEITSELGSEAASGLFTQEDIKRRRGVLPPNIPPAFGVAANLPTRFSIPGIAPLPDINTRRLRPIEDMVDFGFPTTEVGRAALGTGIGKLALRGSEDNAYFQQFLLDQIPGLVPAFKESGIQAAKDREAKARETATALQKQGDFTADQTSRFILQRRGQKDKMDFLKFAEKEIPRLRGEFRLTPAFTERRQRKALAAEQETERETERLDREKNQRLDREKNQRRQRALRSRGRTVVTRA